MLEEALHLNDAGHESAETIEGHPLWSGCGMHCS